MEPLNAPGLPPASRPKRGGWSTQSPLSVGDGDSGPGTSCASRAGSCERGAGRAIMRVATGQIDGSAWALGLLPRVDARDRQSGVPTEPGEPRLSSERFSGNLRGAVDLTVSHSTQW